MITLETETAFAAFNALLSVFDQYNHWESSLWNCAGTGDLQQLMDLADPMFENPMLLTDMNGNVLAISSAFAGEDINAYWTQTRDTGHITAVTRGIPISDTEGNATFLTDRPAAYILPGGTKAIASILSRGGERLGVFELWEYARPFTPADLSLAEVFCRTALSMFPAVLEKSIRSNASVFEDILNGVEFDADWMERLNRQFESPWRILIINNLYRSDFLYIRSILWQVEMTRLPCIPLIYENRIVVLASQRTGKQLIARILSDEEKTYYQAALSLPFSDLSYARARYRQALYTLSRAGSANGLFFCEDYALDYLMYVMAEKNSAHELTHPALDLLKTYDAQTGSQLYESLYQYLYHDGSIKAGAGALHIHRNSFLYRMQKIRQLLDDIDLRDPDTRMYLLLSYRLKDPPRAKALSD